MSSLSEGSEDDLPLKCLSGTAGVPPANEREARKWISNDFLKTARGRRVAGGTRAVPDKHLVGRLQSHCAHSPPGDSSQR